MRSVQPQAPAVVQHCMPVTQPRTSGRCSRCRWTAPEGRGVHESSAPEGRIVGRRRVVSAAVVGGRAAALLSVALSLSRLPPSGNGGPVAKGGASPGPAVAHPKPRVPMERTTILANRPSTENLFPIDTVVSESA